MKIRFQADADLRLPIIKGLKRREPAIDFRTANEAALEGLDDLAVLKIAADDGRLLASHDVSTMPENFARFLEIQNSSGVVLIPQELPYRDAIERLIRLWATAEAELGTTSSSFCRIDGSQSQPHEDHPFSTRKFD